MKYSLVHPESEKVLVEVELENSKIETVRRGSLIEVWVEGQGGICVGGRRVVFLVSALNADGSFQVATHLGTLKLVLVRGAVITQNAHGTGGMKTLKSFMPGKVVKILCKVGDHVKAGDPLIIIEAMKMENEIRAPLSGEVKEVGVEVGKKVETGDLLVKIGVSSS